MIAVDTNILIHAHRSDSPWHAPATAALAKLSRWAIPWPCIHEFLAITTHPKVFAPPTPLTEGVLTIESWMASPLTVLGETEEHWSTLNDLVRKGKVTGPQVHDARIAALCLQHGVDELWSADRDFSRFPTLRVRNPLVVQ